MPHLLYETPETARSGENIPTDGVSVRRSSSPAGRINTGPNAVKAGESWREGYTQPQEGEEEERQDGELRTAKDAEEETVPGKGDVCSRRRE